MLDSKYKLNQLVPLLCKSENGVTYVTFLFLEKQICCFRKICHLNNTAILIFQFQNELFYSVPKLNVYIHEKTTYKVIIRIV